MEKTAMLSQALMPKSKLKQTCIKKSLTNKALPLRIRAHLLPVFLFCLASLSAHSNELLENPQQEAKLASSQTLLAPENQQTAAVLTWDEKIAQLLMQLSSSAEFNPDWLAQILGQAQFNSRVQKLMTPASKTGSTVADWQKYRQRLVTPQRIEAGVAFWLKHEDTLEQVQSLWGVPAEVIVGIIGIETFYGRNTGNFKVLDALATLAFEYPPSHPRAEQRADYFRQELIAFLQLCLENNLDPLSIRGSFAGAMGIAQFMPSSWLRYGQIFGKDAIKADLLTSAEDAIASVANYLRAHNWQSNIPVWYGVSLESNSAQKNILLKPDILPTFDVNTLEDLGALITSSGKNHQGPLALVELKNGNNPPEYVLGTENFYALTRYNQSSYYAMAVLELGAQVHERALSLKPYAR